jgi:hypothetical protein
MYRVVRNWPFIVTNSGTAYKQWDNSVIRSRCGGHGGKKELDTPNTCIKLWIKDATLPNKDWQKVNCLTVAWYTHGDK